MSRRPASQGETPIARLARRLAAHQRLFDPALEPRNRLPWLKPLQAWQSWRLERSFGGFLMIPLAVLRRCFS